MQELPCWLDRLLVSPLQSASENDATPRIPVAPSAAKRPILDCGCELISPARAAAEAASPPCGGAPAALPPVRRSAARPAILERSSDPRRFPAVPSKVEFR